MQILSKIYITLLLLFISNAAQARYATYEEAPIEINIDNAEYEIQKNGKYNAIYESEITILNEMGREQYGSQTLVFTKDVSDIEILEAKTILDDKEYLVPKEHIEIKPLASSEKGFDQKYQILVSYPNVVIGAKLYLKYKENVFTPYIDNHFSKAFYYGLKGFSSNSTIKLVSYIPFEYLVNDPEKNLEVLLVQDKKKKTLTITQKKPVYYKLINEPGSNQLDNNKLSYVNVSTMKDFHEMGKYFAPKYEAVIHQELPLIFEEIVNEAMNLNNENEQIDFITSSLANKVRYMGSWETVAGKFFPRDLNIIAETGFGDCKDFSISTAAMLRKLGYEVNSALIYRGYHYIQNEKILPCMELFNHAILIAKGKSGKEYWIDPTNFVSMSKSTFPDISGRKALILGSKVSKFEYIPQIDSATAILDFTKNLLINNETIIIDASLKLKGEKALNLTGAEITTSKTAIEESLITHFSGETKPLNAKVNLPNLKSRIVKDINIDFSFEKENDLIKSNLGKGIILKNLDRFWVNDFTRLSEENLGISYLDEPGKYIYKTTIKNYKAKTPENLNFELKTKWFTAQRKCFQKEKDLLIEESVEIINPVVSSDDYSTPAFKEIKSKVKTNMQEAIIIGDNIF